MVYEILVNSGKWSGCLTALNHNWNQCSIIINGVLWHSNGNNFTRSFEDINQQNGYENYNSNHRHNFLGRMIQPLCRIKSRTNGMCSMRHSLLFVHISINARNTLLFHYNDVIMSAMASQVTSFTIVYSTVYSGADQRKHQSSASLAFVRGIHRWPVNSPHKGPVTRKIFPFDDVIIPTIIIRKCRDYIYGICQYKLLSIKNLFRMRIIVVDK